MKLAQGLLCHRPDGIDRCGACQSCTLCAAGTHPDLLLVSKPADRAFIPVATFIGERDNRMQEGLCHTLGLKPFLGTRRVAIIDDADYLNEESANCLLKTLEEPPPRSVLILIGTTPQRQLPTIRSRCQLVRFAPLPDDVLAELLVQQQIVPDASQAASLARLAGGSLQRARQLADGWLTEFRQTLLTRLAQPDADSIQLAEAIGAVVDAAGTDAPSRRQRLRQVIETACDFYRQLARTMAAALPSDALPAGAAPVAAAGAPSAGAPSAGAPSAGASRMAAADVAAANAAAAGAAVSNAAVADVVLASAIRAAQAWWPGDAELAAACAERCLQALEHVDRNANQGSLIAAWVDDLTQATLPVATA
jgi:DNA polymerase-3 subunit delta'